MKTVPEIVPEGGEEEEVEEEAPGEVGQPARPPADPLVVLVQDLERLGGDLVALADDDPVLLDDERDRADRGPGHGLPSLRLDLVVGDVGGQEDLAQVREEGPVPGRDLDLLELVGEAPLALPDVEEVADPDGPLAALDVAEGQAALRLAVDEEVLRQDDALVEDLGREADQDLFELGRELQPDEARRRRRARGRRRTCRGWSSGAPRSGGSRGSGRSSPGPRRRGARILSSVLAKTLASKV